MCFEHIHSPHPFPNFSKLSPLIQLCVLFFLLNLSYPVCAASVLLDVWPSSGAGQSSRDHTLEGN